MTVIILFINSVYIQDRNKGDSDLKKQSFASYNYYYVDNYNYDFICDESYEISHNIFENYIMFKLHPETKYNLFSIKNHIF